MILVKVSAIVVVFQPHKRNFGETAKYYTEQKSEKPDKDNKKFYKFHTLIINYFSTLWEIDNFKNRLVQ